MSGTLRRTYKNSEETACQSSPSMHFWGVCCESGKQYAQVVGQRFRITMAVLDPKSFYNDAREKIVSLIVLRGGIEYLLCILKHGEIHQVNLNLIFDKGENVKFYINGHGKVYLSGYQLTDSERDVMNDENGYLCPLVEVKSKSKKSSLNKEASWSRMDMEPVASSTCNKKTDKGNKLNWGSYINEVTFDDSDESDEDFVHDEDSDEQDSSIDSDEELIDISKEELADVSKGAFEDVTQEKKDVSDEESEEETEKQQMFKNSRERRKRRKQNQILSSKRSRSESHNASTSSEPIEDVICIEDSESNDKSISFHVNSRAGSTPTPKKQTKNEIAFSKKKSKKGQMLNEILKNIDLDKEELAEPPAVTCPPKQNKHPVVRLEGGVETQDVIIGKGPIATKGKLLHVFFIGRLPDNSIFDSRVPGKKPFSFKLGANEVIKGWEVALEGMKVGGKRKIKVPSSMAYGNRSVHGIPPNTPLRFIVDLQGIS